MVKGGGEWGRPRALAAGLNMHGESPPFAKATLLPEFRAFGKPQERLILGRVMIFAPGASDRRPVSPCVPLGKH